MGRDKYYNQKEITNLKDSLESNGSPVISWNPRIPERTTGNNNEEDVEAHQQLPKNYQIAESPQTPNARRSRLNSQQTIADIDAWHKALNHFRKEIAKRFTTTSTLVFTDASKKGSSLTGAVHQPFNNRNHSFKISGQDPSLNIVLQRELAAILRALTLYSCMPEASQPLDLFTDSLTAIWLIRRSLYKPESTRTHKHKTILEKSYLNS